MTTQDWNVKAVDMGHEIYAGAMPLCPLCDNEMLEWEEVALVTAHGDIGLAHAGCVSRYAKAPNVDKPGEPG